jgi:hypothetical protein
MNWKWMELLEEATRIHSTPKPRTAEKSVELSFLRGGPNIALSLHLSFTPISSLYLFFKANYLQHFLSQRIENNMQLEKKSVFVFVSSTFTDTEVERNTLLCDVSFFDSLILLYLL